MQDQHLRLAKNAEFHLNSGKLGFVCACERKEVMLCIQWVAPMSDSVFMTAENNN